jgi:molybdopterin biosynthesis enzyme MoaB
VLKIVVITISDRAYKGEYEDLSGPKIGKISVKDRGYYNFG